MTAPTIFSRIAQLSLARSVNSLAAILLIILATRFLTVEDYALFRKAFLPVEMLLPIITLGVPSAIQYLLAGSKNPRRLLADAMSISLAPTVFLAFGSLLYFIFPRDPQESYDPALIALVVSAGVFAIGQATTQTLIPALVYGKRTKPLAIVTMVTAFSSVPISYVLLSLSSTPVVAGTNKLLFAAISATLLLILARRLFKGPAFTAQKSKSLRYRSILSSSIPLGASTAVSTLSINIDKGIVALLALPADFSVYVNGAIEVPLIGIVTGSVATVLVGEMALAYRRGNRQIAHGLFQLAARKTALLLFPATVILWVLAPTIVVFVFGERYAESAVPFRIYLLMLPLRIVVFGSALTAMGRGKTLLFRSAIELPMNLCLSIALYSTIGIAGVALGTVLVSYIWSAPYSMRHIALGFEVNLGSLLPYRELAKIAAISLALSPIAALVLSTIAAKPIAITLAIAFYAIGMYFAYAIAGLAIPHVRR